MTNFAHSMLWVARAVHLKHMTEEHPGLSSLALALADVGGAIPRACLLAQEKRARRAAKRLEWGAA